MSREAMKLALEALEWNYNTDLDNIPACEQWAKMLNETITALRAALAEPEQEPVATVTSETGNPDITMSWWHEPALPVGTRLYTAPTTQREHITDGSPCWCNPDVIEEEGGNVIVHNYEDNRSN